MNSGNLNNFEDSTWLVNEKNNIVCFGLAQSRIFCPVISLFTMILAR